jgi:hypothetical protein
VYLPKGIKVTTNQWQEMVSDAYIWMDYMSVPQIGTHLDSGESELLKAIESIPAYGEWGISVVTNIPTTFLPCRTTPYPPSPNPATTG